MAGESHLMEQAKKQWEKLDAEGHKIINNLLMTDVERAEWPENTEPKFTRKRGAKITKVTYDTKAKRYTYQDSTSGRTDQVRHSKLIHLLQLPSSKKEYVMIDAPNRLDLTPNTS